MNWSPTFILALIALILAVLGIAKPQWPLTATAVILLAVAIMISAFK